LQRGRLAHAYIFYGQEGAGKEAFALELAKALNCESNESRPCQTCPSCQKISRMQHPDVRYIFAMSKQMTSDEISAILKLKASNPYIGLPISGHKNISIDQIRELKNEAKYAPYEAQKRIFIIYGADYFSREAANSFLKLLEEPPQDLIIILIADDFQNLLDTIRSRCQPVYFPAFEDAEVTAIARQYSDHQEDIVPQIRIARNNVKKVFEMLGSDYDEKRQLVYSFIKSAAADQALNVSQQVELMTQKRDKNYVLELLDLLILWMRDAVHFQTLNDRQDFVNIDAADSIEKFAVYYKNAAMAELVRLIEQAGRDIQRNAHPALTLICLAIDLHDELVKSALHKDVA
jgi:DNA polymerase-3 subunit delta'